jgi:uncharacterized protein
MALPKKLQDFNLFGDGNNWQGLIAELSLPKLARKMEEYSGAGMDTPIDLDVGGEKIEFEWTTGGLIEEIFDGFGTSKLDNNQLRFAGAYTRDDTEETVSVEVIVRGRHKEIDMGSAKKPSDNVIKVTTTCVYYKLIIDGVDYIEIDALGYIFKVKGVDRLAKKRQAIGL